jgi:hypothetical protein
MFFPIISGSSLFTLNSTHSVSLGSFANSTVKDCNLSIFSNMVFSLLIGVSQAALKQVRETQALIFIGFANNI